MNALASCRDEATMRPSRSFRMLDVPTLRAAQNFKMELCPTRHLVGTTGRSEDVNGIER